MPVITGTAGWSNADFDACSAVLIPLPMNISTLLVRNEMADFAQKGFWTVLPYELSANFVVSRVSNTCAAFACPHSAVSPNATAAPVSS
jgi:hypothetical protein